MRKATTRDVLILLLLATVVANVFVYWLYCRRQVVAPQVGDEATQPAAERPAPVEKTRDPNQLDEGKLVLDFVLRSVDEFTEMSQSLRTLDWDALAEQGARSRESWKKPQASRARPPIERKMPPAPTEATLLEVVDDEGSDVRLRIDAIRLLGSHRPYAKRATPVLVRRLRDERFATEATKALRSLGIPETTNTPALDAALKEEHENLRMWLVYHIDTENGPVRGLLKLVNSQDESVRAKAVALLGRLGPDATEVTAELSKIQKSDDDPDLRLAASRALQRINREDAQTPLLRELRDPDPIVRGRAVQGLARLGKAAVPALVQVLTDKDASRDTRVSTITTLTRIGADAKQATPALVGLLKDDDALVGKLAGGALLKIDPEAAAKAGVQQ
jgi:HEAT repeat protein